MLASGGPSGSRFLKKAPQKLLIGWRFFLKATVLGCPAARIFGSWRYIF